MSEINFRVGVVNVSTSDKYVLVTVATAHSLAVLNAAEARELRDALTKTIRKVEREK